MAEGIGPEVVSDERVSTFLYQRDDASGDARFCFEGLYAIGLEPGTLERRYESKEVAPAEGGGSFRAYAIDGEIRIASTIERLGVMELPKELLAGIAG